MKYKAIVKAIYEFEFETEEDDIRFIERHAQGIWNAKTYAGVEGQNYHDTEIEVEEK